ncbi:tRNA (guanine(37)-N(1))-methyltransferase [Epargyreus clarus]|uniref:tRNA (guanine(37)-N(1))-methyltransferase n=1 Tax=Epargyreus clarus TaxID=520877 RepID=UPI003C2BD28D
MIFGQIRVLISKMSTLRVSLVPDAVQGMKQLDREKFQRTIAVPVLHLCSDKVAKALSVCKPYILKLENFKPVQNLCDDDKFDRRIYLNPLKVECWTDIPEEVRQSFSSCDVSEDNFISRQIQLKYENYSYEDIFKAVLPEGEETVSGFSHIGHIIHLNLRDHLLEYKTLIGTVLVDKIKTCRTVVNKCNIIDNTYRNFKMEVIAGDEDFFVTVKESNCHFQFDFSKVYWNPRLCNEHDRVLKTLKPNDILFDVFCGVGPFAVPAARKKCRVFANDLNPDSFKWLNHNAEHNNIKKTFFKSYNLDGKDFICNIFKKFLIDCCKKEEVIHPHAKIYVTMNLPALAVEFLKYFNGLLDDRELFDKFHLDIIVYVYCFAPGDDPVEIAKKMVIDNIGRDVTSLILNVFGVRNVSPTKEMMKVTLKLTKEILFGVSDQDCNEPPSKKKCVESATEN